MMGREGLGNFSPFGHETIKRADKISPAPIHQFLELLNLSTGVSFMDCISLEIER